ncbi:hypothetical protein ADK41_10710 [Streptomyces caelestis]|uniref:Ricin B lectin domain-containing protein n=1 Tax=Streptomyces caelestis TaxID=36816 RepID=A0A0M8QKB9_9ACTN|nr:hypothetical protein ADK41_10710 [Streptomyces caelestis]KOV33674.1 hypothetical protein ADK58_05470 [Streptomyces sp. XY152]
MRRAYASLLALCLALAGAPVTAGPAQAAPQTIANGTRFTDRSGNPVHAHGGGDQKYWFKPVGGGHHQPVVRSSGLCVQENASTVTQEDCDASATGQQWSVTTTGSYATVVSRATGECLDVNGGSTADSAAVITYTCNGGANQQWTRGT